MAGGQGTRGRPYTEYIPKAMIPVLDRPLIDHVLEYVCASDVVDEVIVISDFGGIGLQTKNYIIGGQWRKKVTMVQDSQSGTGGDLLHAESQLAGSVEFLLWFVDNLCALDIASMLTHFRKKRSMACVATRTSRKEETGFAVVRDGMVERFVEKPIVSLPMAECLGVYILSTELLDAVKAVGSNVNLSYDILQDLARRGGMSAYDIGNLEWIDIESPVVLERNRQVVERITRLMES